MFKSIKNILILIGGSAYLAVDFLLHRKEFFANYPHLDTSNPDFVNAAREMVKRMGELDTEGLYKTDDEKFEAARMIVQESMVYDQLSAAEIAGDIDRLIARSAEFY